MRDAATRPDQDAAQATLLGIVDALAAELRPGRPPRPARLESQLDRDLGFDSLGRVELIARLEQAFAVTLGERVAVEAETPGDLLRPLATAPAAADRPPATPRQTVQPGPKAARLDLPEDAQSWLDVLASYEAGGEPVRDDRS